MSLAALIHRSRMGGKADYYSQWDIIPNAAAGYDSNNAQKIHDYHGYCVVVIRYRVTSGTKITVKAGFKNSTLPDGKVQGMGCLFNADDTYNVEIGTALTTFYSQVTDPNTKTVGALYNILCFTLYMDDIDNCYATLDSTGEYLFKGQNV